MNCATPAVLPPLASFAAAWARRSPLTPRRQRSWWGLQRRSRLLSSAGRSCCCRRMALTASSASWPIQRRGQLPWRPTRQPRSRGSWRARGAAPFAAAPGTPGWASRAARWRRWRWRLPSRSRVRSHGVAGAARSCCAASLLSRLMLTAAPPRTSAACRRLPRLRPPGAARLPAVPARLLPARQGEAPAGAAAGAPRALAGRCAARHPRADAGGTGAELGVSLLLLLPTGKS